MNRIIYAIVCLVTIFSLFFWIVYFDPRKLEIYRFRSENIVEYEFIAATDSDLACKVPKLNPWDPLILPWIKHPKNVSCPKVQRYMTFVDDDGYLTLNETEATLYKKNKGKNFTCYYSTFDRARISTDNMLTYDDEIVLHKRTRLKKDYVKVECYADDSEQFYFNFHAHPSSSRNLSRFDEPTEDQLSVFVFILDSVSNSALQRNLPLTLNYTSNVMGVKYLQALNKVGDNSMPNFMAMFMGKRTDHEQDDMPVEMKGDFSQIQFDSWPLIWKNFSAKGYATVFNEDNPQVGLFHFERKGFARKPVDFYHHTFWVAVQAESNHNYVCFKNELKARMMHDLTRRQVIQMKHKLQFLLTTTMEMSHDNDNEVEMLDEDLKRFWQQLYEGGYLNKTSVIFASDHGLRLGHIRETLIGLIEERLPFFGIWFPRWFYDKHPDIERNIESNKEILSSSFDVYETLLDILNANWYNGSQRSPSSRGQSQLYPLPKNRTCTEAGIPDHYCTCSTETHLPLNDSLVDQGAKFLVEHLNYLLRNVSDICHQIKLNKIRFAKLVDVNGKVKQGVHNKEEVLEYNSGNVVRNTANFTKEIRIGVETFPHKALFDGLLRKHVDGRLQPWTVIGSISRNSKYRGLSDCVHDFHLRKYCSCKDVPIPVN